MIEAYRQEAEGQNRLPTSPRYAKPTAEELAKFAEQLTEARAPRDQAALLRKFASRPFPNDAGILLDLVCAEDRAVSRAAIAALSQIRHPSVRSLAFRLIETRAPHRDFSIDLLAANYEPGDFDIALRWFEREQDRHILHSLGSGMSALWKLDPESDAIIPMCLDLRTKPLLPLP